MSLQKYRADTQGDTCPNGATPWFSRWLGGPSLAKIANCPTTDLRLSRRTVYVTGEADTWFSIPAACAYKGHRIVGWIGCEDGEWVFHLMDSARAKIDAIQEGRA
jgi:hypothetical protein